MMPVAAWASGAWDESSDGVRKESSMIVKRTISLIMLVIVLIVPWSCAPRKVIDEQIRTESEGVVQFNTLVQDMDRYIGKAVILGGYILETKSFPGETTFTVLQTPLVSGEEPDSKDRSQGGFVLIYKGSLKPDLYEKDRRVTVAGKVIARVHEQAANCPDPCVKLEYRQIYLWPLSEGRYASPRPTIDDWNLFPMDRMDIP
jgi:outer membrane lipoprotein